jgi:hypothetical protein
MLRMMELGGDQAPLPPKRNCMSCLLEHCDFEASEVSAMLLTNHVRLFPRATHVTFRDGLEAYACEPCARAFMAKHDKWTEAGLSVGSIYHITPIEVWWESASLFNRLSGIIYRRSLELKDAADTIERLKGWNG